MSDDDRTRTAAPAPEATDPTGERLVDPSVYGQGSPPDGPLEDLAGRRLDRRRFLATGAAAGAGVAALAAARPGTLGQEGTPATGPTGAPAAVTAAAGTGSEAGAAQPDHSMAPAEGVGPGFTYFVPYQAAIVSAAAARLIPADDLGPGATEAGVVYFIDRQLSKGTNVGFRGPAYVQGPFLEGEATQGDQSGMKMADRWRLGIQGIEDYAQQTYGRGFAQLDPAEQDQILADMEAGLPETFDGASLQSVPLSPAPSGQEASIQQAGEAGVGAKAFFDLLLSYTFAGFFADPVHGGNRDMVGWRLIGFPGAQIGYGADILNYGQPFGGDFISLAQYQQQVSGGG